MRAFRVVIPNGLQVEARGRKYSIGDLKNFLNFCPKKHESTADFKRVDDAEARTSECNRSANERKNTLQGTLRRSNLVTSSSCEKDPRIRRKELQGFET